MVAQLTEDVHIRRDIPLALFEIVGDPIKDQYLGKLRDLIVQAISPKSLARYTSEYRATLGRVNHLQLVPAERSRHARQ